MCICRGGRARRRHAVGNVFSENERVLSSSSMNEIFLDEKTRIELYTSQSWESLQANPLFKDLMEFKDVCSLNPYLASSLRAKALERLSSNRARRTVS